MTNLVEVKKNFDREEDKIPFYTPFQLKELITVLNPDLSLGSLEKGQILRVVGRNFFMEGWEYPFCEYLGIEHTSSPSQEFSNFSDNPVFLEKIRFLQHLAYGFLVKFCMDSSDSEGV